MQAIMFVPFSLKLIFPCIPHNYSVSKNHTTLLFFLKICYTYFTFLQMFIYLWESSLSFGDTTATILHHYFKYCCLKLFFEDLV